ncbi:MAG: hypothetical protein ACI4F4_00630 [Lachnospiraceae bacterium]
MEKKINKKEDARLRFILQLERIFGVSAIICAIEFLVAVLFLNNNDIEMFQSGFLFFGGLYFITKAFYSIAIRVAALNIYLKSVTEKIKNRRKSTSLDVLKVFS